MIYKLCKRIFSKGSGKKAREQNFIEMKPMNSFNNLITPREEKLVHSKAPSAPPRPPTPHPKKKSYFNRKTDLPSIRK